MLNPPSSKDLNSLISQFESSNIHSLGDNNRLFLRRIFANGIHQYCERLSAIGFSEASRVLDAGCGFGQWSLALASLNYEVECCDISPIRIQFLNQLADSLKASNINAQISGIDTLPFSDESFDAVFCYGVLFLTPWRQSLQELVRVLKPGGKLYVNANGFGWYAYLWHEEHNKADDYDPKHVAAKCLYDTLTYDRTGIYKPGMNLLIEQDEIIKSLKKLGMTNIQTSCEGGLHLETNSNRPKPFFPGEFKGLPAVYEVCAHR